jgi:hypothetical protein
VKTNLVRNLFIGAFAFAPIGLVNAQEVVPTTPRECVEELRAYRMSEIFALGYFDAPYIPKKEIEQKVSARAVDCEKRFPTDQVKGKQLDALAEIYALARHDDQAQAIFTKRLAEPGITIREKGQALNAAVKAFNTPDYPDRVPTAEKYLAQLNALPMAEAGKDIVDAHLDLANTFRLLGQQDKQVALSVKGLTLAKQLVSLDRGALQQDIISTYADMAEVYSTMPDAKAKLDAMAAIVNSPAMPDPPMLKQGLTKAISRGYQLGKVAPGVYANNWFNRDAPPNGTLTFANSPIPNVVQFTRFG